MGGVIYSTHVENIGWQDEVQDGDISGTEGQSLRLEAIKIYLYGSLADYYDIYYCVHVQNFGWLDWAKNGEIAGTTGYSYRLESIMIKFLYKNDVNAPAENNDSYIGVNGERNYNYINYETHVQNIGWQSTKYDGATAGTTGSGLRVESIIISKGEDVESLTGEIQYLTHIQDIGWESDWQNSGSISGTVGQSKRLEAIRIQLTDQLAELYDVYYRTHVENYGWLDWAKNGEESGSQGYSYRMEAIQIVLVKKSTDGTSIAPGSTTNPFRFDKVSYLNSLLSSEKYYINYYTEESSVLYQELMTKASDSSYINSLSKSEIKSFAEEIIESATLLEYKVGTVAPVVYITTDSGTGNSIEKSNGYITTEIAIIDLDGTLIDQDGQIKVRGNSTSVAPKKPYTIKFDKKQDVLGMGSAKKWALLANLYDPSQFRNAVAFDLAQEMGLDYTSEYQFVELYIDGTYKGLYQLIEPVEEGKTRVNIDLDDDEWLIEVDAEPNRSDPDVTYFTIDCGIRFGINEPEEPSDNLVSTIKNTLNNIVNIMKTGTFEQLKDLIDIDSFSKFFVLNDLFKDVDFDYSSTRYYYKNGLLYAGPVWDFDLSMGNVFVGSDYDSVRSSNYSFSEDRGFFKYLMRFQEFVDNTKSIYNQYKDFITNIYCEGGLLDSYLEEYSSLIDKNQNAGWYSSINWARDYAGINLATESTYVKNFNNLKTWLENRNNWLMNYYGLDEGTVNYATHVQDYGWFNEVNDGNISGTTGASKRVEAFYISLSDELEGSILYKSHIQNIGWESEWKQDGEVSGTTGQSLQVEAVQIKLDDTLSEKYDVYYRVHVSNIGWMDWVCNGEIAGTTGKSYAIEAIEIKLVEKVIN